MLVTLLGITKTLCRHQETTLTTTQLERHEEEHVGKEGSEGVDEYALRDPRLGHDDLQDEKYLECGDKPAGEFENDGSQECAWVLVVEGSYLTIDIIEFLTITLDERLCPPFQQGNMT